MSNYQGFDTFEEMMAERRNTFSINKSPLDLRTDASVLLTELSFERTKYIPQYTEYTNPEGYVVRLSGSTYTIFLPNKKKHSQGNIAVLNEKLRKRIEREKIKEKGA